MKISFPKVQGEEVMHVDQMRVEFKLQSCRLHLDNLFNGNKVLGKVKTFYLHIITIKYVKYFQ